MNKSTIQNIGVLVVAIAVLAGGYWYFFTDDDGNATQQPQAQSANGQPEEVRNLVQLLHSLQEVNVDPALMDRIPHEQLRDFRLEVPAQERGRENPFAPSSALPNPSSQ